MSLSTTADKILLRILRGRAWDSQFLRTRFRKLYGIDVGLYTLGAFDRWRIPLGTRIGRYCSIAASARIIDANHPTDGLSTHPFFYEKSFGLVSEDRVHVAPPMVEDDVWLGHQCVITPGCKLIGRGAIIGANAVVMGDVPRYAIMGGSPAKLIRYRFPPDVMAAIEATRWWTLDKDELRQALDKSGDFGVAPSLDTAEAFMRATGITPPPRAAVDTGKISQVGGKALTPAAFTAIIQREKPDFADTDLDLPLAQLGIDSFGLINLRIAMEQAIGAQISDHVWGSVHSAADIRTIVTNAGSTPTVSAQPQRNAPSTAAASARRDYELNMPQMALRGLSESWLFKEVGDIHWGLITSGLGTSSADIADATGSRLYATFTRFLMQSTVPLSRFRENDRFSIDMEISRYGAGMFFGNAQLNSPSGSLTASVMTSFSKFGESGANVSLLKGQPVIPDTCPIGALSELPPFGNEYRARRAEAKATPIFETEYNLQPPHDINGVGLLYFAAYPMINEICALRHSGSEAALTHSTVKRDVYYFANCDISETLVFRIHKWEQDDAGLSFESSISRKSDDVTMAYLITEKQAVR
jgi:probable biosynthetic protein (TIGR04098 family)